VAIVALFTFNLWQKITNHALDNLEIIATKFIHNL